MWCCITASNCIGDYLPVCPPWLLSVKSCLELSNVALPDMLIYFAISERISFWRTSGEDELAQDKPRSGEWYVMILHHIRQHVDSAFPAVHKIRCNTLCHDEEQSSVAITSTLEPTLSALTQVRAHHISIKLEHRSYEHKHEHCNLICLMIFRIHSELTWSRQEWK